MIAARSVAVLPCRRAALERLRLRFLPGISGPEFGIEPNLDLIGGFWFWRYQFKTAAAPLIADEQSI